MIQRTLMDKIRYLLSQFPCVCILGARQVGKSTLLRELLPNAPLYDLERERDFLRIESDAELFLAQQEGPIILDEAQLYPSLFLALRVKIDQNRQINGQFLISGSSSPELLNQISETLAGRVAMIHLGPFTLNEIKGYPNSLFYEQLLHHSEHSFLKLNRNLSLDEVYESCLRGGYPEIVLRQDAQFSSIWMNNYLQTYVYRDVSKLFPGLDRHKFRKFISVLAHCSGKTMNYSSIARSLDISQPTVKQYTDIAEGTFLFRKLLPYEKNVQKRIQKNPKGLFRDTGILSFLLNISSKDHLLNYPEFGFIWETFVIEQVLRGLESTLIPFQYYYYRTYNGAEVDLVIEGPDGILIPIEIKSGISTHQNQLKALNGFMDEHNCPFAVLINADQQVLKLTERIYQVPALYL